MLSACLALSCGGKAVLDAPPEPSLCAQACALGAACRDANTDCRSACAFEAGCSAERDAYWQCMVDNVGLGACVMPETCVSALATYVACEPTIVLSEPICALGGDTCECRADYAFAAQQAELESRCALESTGDVNCDCRLDSTVVGSCSAGPVTIDNACYPLRGCCSTLLHLPR